MWIQRDNMQRECGNKTETEEYASRHVSSGKEKKLATKQIASVEVMYLFKRRRIFDRRSWASFLLFQLCSSASSTFHRNGA